MNIKENYQKILTNIEEIAKSCGRNANEVTLIPVSKTFPVETLIEAQNSGISLFGENKVQEAKQKFSQLQSNFSFHLIGHLQSNKAKDAVKIFDLIHSIDKISTAVKVSNEAEKISKIQNILLQVNTSGENTKSGIDPNETLEIATELDKIPNIKLCGLMTIGPFTDNENEIRKSFALLRDLKEQINLSTSLNLTELSMGMSADYKIAIEEGSTMVRVGSAIFGNRDYSIKK